MKKVYLILFLLIAVNAQAQIWGWGDTTGPWIRVAAQMTEGCNTSYKVAGGVPYRALIDRGLPTIGSGRDDYGYYIFEGQWEIILPDTVYQPYLTWPPSLITPEYVVPGHNNVYSYDGCYECWCDTIAHVFPDTLLLVDAFGFWQCNPPCGFFPPVNTGYIRSVSHPMACFVEPCPEGGGGGPKQYLTVHFANRDYAPLPDTGSVIISGDSPLYITAHSFYALDHLTAYVCLDKFPFSPIDTVRLQRFTTNDWHGIAKSGRQLELMSYASAIVWVSYESIHSWDRVDVCLPLVVPSRDTIFIRTDSMIIAENPSVSLYIVDDTTHNMLSTNDIVADAGYKYKSRWTANANRPKDHKTYYRQFPSDSTYRNWNGTASRCQVTFNRDSLYVVGGSLTFECKGHLKPVNGIDNSFLVSTDTLNHAHTDTFQTKRILVDKDPDNSLFFDSLQYDIIKALAWQEYAGSVDTRHCYEHLPDGNHFNRRYNNYWDYFIDSHGDTCFDTRTPCENTGSTATGTMQIVRTQFEDLFDGRRTDTAGYYISIWDSLAWNWKINIHNGKYIFFPYNKHHMRTDQQSWDSVCVLCNPADMVPQYPNREDLSSYGYHLGIGAMGNPNLNKNTWLSIMSGYSDGAMYVKAVRLHKYVKPWQL